MSGAQFDASLPPVYSEKWREAYKKENGDSPRMASYQPPGGEAIPFVQKSFRFSGGQSKDTAEYPFGGLWSNEYLNEKPQNLSVEGFLRGPSYIAQRNKLIEALRIPTDDGHPGYIDLPFWGRFPVVVGDNYEISENSDEQGQCAVSIPFVRAGASVEERQTDLSESAAQVENAAANLQEAAIENFEESLADGDDSILAAAFPPLKNLLLGILGRVQGSKTALDAMTGEILGIMNLVNQGIRAPRELARALFNAAASIAAGVQEIKNGAALYGGESGAGNGSGNEKNAAILFLSASSYTLPVETATVSQENAKTAVENLYRATSFFAAIKIISNMDSVTRANAGGYWRLLEKLEESVDRENPAVYAAIAEARAALSRELSSRELSGELNRDIAAAAPLLFLSRYLGCDEGKLRELNNIADSFLIKGNIVYV